MNRLPTILAAAFGIAASSSLCVFAGPSHQATDVREATESPAPAPGETPPAPPAATILLDAAWQSGFGPGELHRQPPTSSGAAAGRPTDLAVESSQDVSDFISPFWLEKDAEVQQFAAPLAHDEAGPVAEAASIASSDVTTLSVPEVPLPPGVIPGLAGVVFAFIMHRRSLKGSNMPK